VHLPAAPAGGGERHGQQGQEGADGFVRNLTHDAISGVRKPQGAFRVPGARRKCRVVKQPTILIVEDDQDTADSVKLILEGEGYRTLHALNAEECIAESRAARTDLI